MIYSIVFIILAIIGFVRILLDNNGYIVKQRNVFVFATIIFLTGFSGLRNNVGLDFQGYEDCYYAIHRAPLTVFRSLSLYQVEPGYAFLNLISPTFHFFLCLMAALSVGIAYYAAKKFAISNFPVFFLFYYASVYLYYVMGVMREGLAISIVYVAITYLRKDKKRFIIIVFITALLFHSTALLALPLLMITERKLSRKIYYGITAAALALSIEINALHILTFINNIFGNAYIAHKLFYYQVEANPITQLSGYARATCTLILFIELYVNRTRIGEYSLSRDDCDEYSMLLVNTYFIGVIEMILLGSATSILAVRGSAYLYTCQIFIICKLIENKDKKAMNIIIYVLFAILFIFTLINTVYHSSGKAYLPYSISF